MPGSLRRVAMKLRPVLSCHVLDKGHVINRPRTLKDKYVLAKEASSQSSFFMTPDGRIAGDDITWEAYVQAHPKARPLPHSAIHHYDKSCIIFGVDQANGNLSYEPNGELPLSNLHLDDTSDAPEYMNVDPDTPTNAALNGNPPEGGGGTFGNGGQSSRARAKSQIGQKRRRSLPGYDKFDDYILIMAEASKEMASLFKKLVMPRLLPAMKEIPESSHGDIKHAMIVFGRDHASAEILMSMDKSIYYEFLRDMIG